MLSSRTNSGIQNLALVKSINIFNVSFIVFSLLECYCCTYHSSYLCGWKKCCRPIVCLYVGRLYVLGEWQDNMTSSLFLFHNSPVHDMNFKLFILCISPICFLCAWMSHGLHWDLKLMLNCLGSNCLGQTPLKLSHKLWFTRHPAQLKIWPNCCFFLSLTNNHALI